MTELEDQLRARIRAAGPLSFREVMAAALYDPALGYYTRLTGFGAAGDFITSPERHPAFGWLLGRQALDVWQALGEPRPFRVLELGAGSGALAEPFVGFLRGYLGEEIVYTIDEVSPALRAAQQARLREPAFRWDGTDEAAHFIIANEVADALPVTRGIVRHGRLHELRVGLDAQDALTWDIADTESAELEAYFAGLHYRPAEGEVVDVALGLGEWVASIAARLDRGAALVLDYAASPPRDSLLTYYRHTMGSDPLIRLGQQDISAHVDFRTLIRLAIASGVQAGATAQRGLLLNLGFQEVVSQLPGPTDRQALLELVDANGLGGKIAAVFLLRGMPGYKPVGAVGGREWPAPTGVPTLPPDRDEADFLMQWREAFERPDNMSSL